MYLIICCQFLYNLWVCSNVNFISHKYYWDFSAVMSNLFDPIFFNISQSVGTEKGGKMVLVWILKGLKNKPETHSTIKARAKPFNKIQRPTKMHFCRMKKNTTVINSSMLFSLKGEICTKMCDKPRTATAMRNNPTLILENLISVEISKNHFDFIWTSFLKLGGCDWLNFWAMPS